MDLRSRINASLKAAMKERDATRTATLRLMSAAIRDREIAMRAEEGDGMMTDSDVRDILARMIRQRRESSHAYEEAGRLDQAEAEHAEIAVIEEFLPRPLSEGEVDAAIDSVIGETGARSIRDMGRVMAALKARHAGRMDFADAGARVKQRLC